MWFLGFSYGGEKCPRCGSTNTHTENGIRVCYECDYEWQLNSLAVVRKVKN